MNDVASTTTSAPAPYQARKWNLSGLRGISDKTLEVHFGLYEGYVKNTNLLDEQLAQIAQSGGAAGTNLAFAELTRRLGFEANGMRLHEYYFDNLTATQETNRRTPRFEREASSGFGSFEKWHEDFAAIGTMRGVGWAIAYYDPGAKRLRNHWVTLHEDGNVAGLAPILVMDAWEHAFLFDYKPSERAKYVEAFFDNVNWTVVEERLASAQGQG